MKIGDKFNKIEIVEILSEKTKRGERLFKCRCECGKELIVPRYRFGLKKCIYSCGCSDKRKTAGGKHKHPLHNVWVDMKNRCYYEKDIGYRRYGGRGIAVCDEWRNNFMSFYNWSMENGYEKGLQLDRIDNNRNYEPSNCRWTDSITQNNNKGNNRLLTYNGETKTIMEWSRLTGIKRSTIAERLKRNWTIEDALTTPFDRRYKKRDNYLSK